MAYKGVYLLLLVFFLVGSVSAQQSLGTFEAGQSVILIQSCDDSSYSNISKITYPDSSLALDAETSMIKSGDTYSYSFSNTSDLGQYIVYGHCDEGGSDVGWVYDFDITYNGQKVSLSNTTIVFALMGLAAIFLTISFFFSKDYWILKSFFQFLAVLAGLISVNSARIIASESNSLGTMGEMGLLLMIVVLGLFFLWIFIRAFKEIIKVFRAKGAVRWNYDD